MSTPQELVLAHLPLVDALASRMRRQVLLGADLDELIGRGALGLCEAAARYDEAQGPFAGYAFWRIRGAMLDGARRTLRGGKDRVRMVSYEAAGGAALAGADSALSAGDVLAIRQAMAALPERERRLVEAVEIEGRTLEEAGGALGLTRSGASRARGRALEALRERLS